MVHTTQTRPSRYRLYIDESGDHTFKLLDDLYRRYLILLGVWFRTPEYIKFSDDFEAFRRDIFGARPDDPVIFHRADIVNRKGPFVVLREEAVRARFDDGLLQLVGQADYKMICVLINKQNLQDQYKAPFHPYHYGLAVMLERYCGWLNYKNVVGDVMAESRGREEDLQLKEAYLRVYESGTRFFSHDLFQKVLTSKEIKIKPKVQNIAGLQLSDILAHPIGRAVQAEEGIIDHPGELFGKRVFEASQDKFNRNERTGVVRGYGKVSI